MIRIPHFTSRRATDSRRSKLNSLAVYVFCALLLAASVARGQEASAPSFRLPDAPAGKQTSTIEARIRRGEAPLSRIYEGIALDSSAIYRLPPLEKREMGQDGSAKRLKIGAVRILPETLEPGANARIYRVPNGRVSLIGIESAAALQVRVQFMNVNLPKGAKLFVYSMRNRDEIYGSFEGRGPLGNGEFWTPPVEGDGIIIEYFSPGDESRTVFPFQISRITHIFKDAAVIETPSTDAAGLCNLSVTAEWANIAKSVGRLSFVSGGGSYVCTGTLLNTQANDGSSKYLLTANHCISTPAEAQSLRVRWFYDTPSSAPVFTDGSSLLATGTQSDFTLLQLTGALPGGVTLAGWTTTMPTVSTPVTGIHHPAGDYKRIAFGGRRAGGCPAGLMCLPVGWDAGTTEGGSSGSGLWVGSASSAPQLVGNLSGGDASCSNLTGSDYYGRFDITYPSIASYLSPTPPPINPLDTVDYFVRQQYRDFLNREADASGLQFWTQTLQGYLNACGTTNTAEANTCRARARAAVSEAFFVSVEFQETGYLVYRLYKSAYPESPARPRGLLRFTEFLRDAQAIGSGVVVNQPGWEQKLEANTQSLMREFVQRGEFTARFPETMTGEGYVSLLLTTVNLPTTGTEKDAALNAYAAGGVEGRARALRSVAESNLLFRKEFNKAFVLMQYFGYLRRNADEGQDAAQPFAGYDFWLTKLNNESGDTTNLQTIDALLAPTKRAQMVEAFVVTGEYRRRFGPE